MFISDLQVTSLDMLPNGQMVKSFPSQFFSDIFGNGIHSLFGEWQKRFSTKGPDIDMTYLPNTFCCNLPKFNKNPETAWNANTWCQMLEEILVSGKKILHSNLNAIIDLKTLLLELGVHFLTYAHETIDTLYTSH